MNTLQGRDSAKIIPFPVRHRTTQDRSGTRFPGTETRMPAFVTCDAGSGSYHEAAIQDAARGKN